MKIKILHIIPFFSPKFGGSVNTVYGLTKKLAQRGHEVSILTTTFHFDKKYANSLVDVNVIPIKYFINWGLFIYSPRITDFLKKNLQHFDIIMLHEYRSYQNAIVSKYAKIHSVPFCLDAHGTLLPFWHWQKLKKIYDIVWGKKMLNETTEFIVSTNDEKQQYLKYGVDFEKISIIPRGIDISQYNIIIDNNLFRQKYNIGSDDFVILYLGRIHSIKGLDLLTYAYSKLTKVYENIVLVIAGSDDGYLLSLKNQISNYGIEKKVIITGHLYEDEKIMALKTADLVVVPSYYESFGNVIVEAMASKTPVLVSKKCGILQTVSEEIMHVCDSDKESLYDAIQKIYLDENYRKKFVIRAFEYTEMHFSWKNVVQQFESLFYKIINDRQTG